jgi:hypothetical protein
MRILRFCIETDNSSQYLPDTMGTPAPKDVLTRVGLPAAEHIDQIARQIIGTDSPSGFR